ncbi:MAG TPA: hypothetical protein VHD56_12115 [Tepidisphaeraceae bacterium]|nr:hypothetical protein [Tepidisphaeraceae bacterium]
MLQLNLTEPLDTNWLEVVDQMVAPIMFQDDTIDPAQVAAIEPDDQEPERWDGLS